MTSIPRCTIGYLARPLAAAAATVAAAGTAPAQGVVQATHWRLADALRDAAGREDRAMRARPERQAEDRPNLTLLVIVLKTADGKARLLRMVAPLGVLLPAGLGLKIDQADIGRAGFVRCLPTGCIAEAILDDTLSSQLKGGQTATFIVFQTPEEGIGIRSRSTASAPGSTACRKR